MKTCRASTTNYLTTHRLPIDPRQKQEATPENTTTDTDNHRQPPTPTPTTTDTSTDNRPKKKPRKSKPTDKVLAAEGNNEKWMNSRKCFRIIVDSNLLYEFITGQSASKDLVLIPYFNNITNKMSRWLSTGRKTPIAGGDPIEWRARVLNYGADIQCEKVLDDCSSFIWHHHNFLQFVRLEANLFIQSDRGCRFEGYSATGWRIRASDPRTLTCTTIAEGGTLHVGNLSSTHIETLALHEVVTHVDRYIYESRS